MSTSADDPDREPQAREPDTVSLPVGPDDQWHVRRDGLDESDEAAVARLPRGCALLVASRGPHPEGRFLLDQDRTTVGRDSAADIVLDDVTVSRKHAEFVRVVGVFEVRDLASLNGTYVNRLRVDASSLRPGDEIRIGAFRILFLPSPQDR